MSRRNVAHVALGTAAAGVLTLAVVAGLIADRRAPAHGDGLASAAPTAGPSRERAGPRDIGGAAGEPAAAGRELMAARDILRATIDAVEAPQQYWRDEAHDHARYIETLIAASARARADLVDAYGAAAVDDAAFRWLFRPLDRRFPFLSSEQQIAVHEAELRLSAHVASQSDDAPNVPHVDAFERHVLDLEERIGDAAAFEYALRAAPLAAQIRASGVELSEPEFRDVYALLAPLGRSEPSRADYYDVRRALRNLLGSQRFASLWAARDPRYAELAQVGARHGLSEDAVMSAYLVLNDSQDALLAAALGASGNAESDAARLREIYDDSRARLADVVGEETARAITSTLSLSGHAMSARPLPQLQ